MPKLLSELRLYITNRIITSIPSHWLRQQWYRYACKFKIDKSAAILMGASFDAAGGLTIGQNSVVNSKVRLDTRGGITIGANVSISSDVIILTADHDLQDANFTGRQRPVVVEDYVFIGTRAMILPGVTLGHSCAVGAGSVVTKSVPSKAIVAGVPAREIAVRQIVPASKLAEYKRLFQ